MELKKFIEWLQSESKKCIENCNSERMENLTISADMVNEYLDTIIDNK